MVVAVGYQRPRCIGGELGQPPAVLKRLMSGRPWSSLMWPPATRSRPSGRNAWPAQNRLSALGRWVKPPVAGFQTCGSPARPHESTCPFGRRCRCTATIGPRRGCPGRAALQAPSAAGAAAATGARRGGCGRAAAHALVGAHRHPLRRPGRSRPPRAGGSRSQSRCSRDPRPGPSARSTVPRSPVPTTWYVTRTGSGSRVDDHEAVAAGVFEPDRRQDVVAAARPAWGRLRAAPRRRRRGPARRRWRRPGRKGVESLAVGSCPAWRTPRMP